MAVFALGTEGAAADGRRSPTVIELFTSQSCYSCPPAEAFLGQLIGERDDIVALEFHVDYWDKLVYRNKGSWKDIFSSPAYTARQYGYARTLGERGYAYTPQMVIGGVREVQGSRRDDVVEILNERRADDVPRLAIDIAVAAGGGLRVGIDGAVDAPAEVWLVAFKREHTTEVPRGENAGKTLTNRNIVTDMQRIGEWRGTSLVLAIPDGGPTGDHGCAILIQHERQGPILGAALCPGFGS